MKLKLLCIAVIFTFVFGGFFNPAQAVGFTDTDGTKYETPANVLHALGFVEGYSDGTFDIGETMTRAEFATILSRLSLLADVDNNKVYFYDVSSSHWAINSINNVCAQGLMSGDEKYFRPDDAVTLDDVSRGIVTLLGYAPQVSGNSFTATAISLGVFKGVSPGANISRGDVLIAMYNSLSINLPVVTKFNADGGIMSKVDRETNILSANFNIFKEKGQFTAVGDIDLVRVTNLRTDYVRIDDVLYKLGNDVQIGKELLGHVTEFYFYDADDDSIPVILYYKTDKSNEVIEVEAGDISSQSSTTELLYHDEGGRLVKQRISTAAKFIVNGYIINDSEKSDSLFDIASGGVKIVIPQNELNEVVWIDRYEYHQVSSPGVKSLFLSDGKVLDLDKDRDDLVVNIFTLTGDPAAINDITSDTGIALAEVVAADGKTYRSVYILKSISGIASEIGSGSLVINDREYKMLESINTSELRMGFLYTFFIGIDDKICMFDPDIESALTFGYLVNVGMQQKGLTTRLEFKILNSNGSCDVYEAADTIYVNDKPVKRADLSKDDNYLFTYLYTGSGGAKTVHRQVIAYMENDEGKVTEIYTAQASGTDNAVLTFDVFPESRVCKSSAIFNFGGELTIKDSGFIVAAPANASTAEDDDYEVWPVGHFVNDGSYVVEGYNVNELLEADIIVVTVANTDIADYNESNTYTCVFDKKSIVMLDDGTQSYAITYWQQGSKYTKTLLDRSGKTSHENTLKEIEKLGRGDCFMIELTGDDSMIKNINIEFSESNRTGTMEKYNSGRLMYYGKIQAISANTLVIRKFVDMPDLGYTNSDAFLFKNAGRVMTYLYTGDDRPIEYVPNSLAEARVGDWVVFQARHAAARTMVIYRDDKKLPSGNLIK
ncbi:MAG: S-layer homology domain-containing protein [Firmicutes bacterium]|nr:S-layer homology domain-containing protein [Bacillota bacterium]